MSGSDPLDIEYITHERVRRLIDAVQFCVEDISQTFDRWEEPHTTGPGLYFAVVSGHSIREYADPMGDSVWPVDRCRNVLEDVDAFYDAAEEIALTEDGAVVISVDGVVQAQMVRFRDDSFDSPDSVEQSPQYADWMGSRHMSAADTSTRPEVVTTITLSAETGHVTLFEDGEHVTRSRAEINAEYR